MPELKAPWSKEVVSALLDYQTNLEHHPYTCNNGHVLYPTEQGFKCNECGYSQDWCYDFTITEAMKKRESIVVGVSELQAYQLLYGKISSTNTTFDDFVKAGDRIIELAEAIKRQRIILRR